MIGKILLHFLANAIVSHMAFLTLLIDANYQILVQEVVWRSLSSAKRLFKFKACA